jgi:hypothetical protein
MRRALLLILVACQGGTARPGTGGDAGPAPVAATLDASSEVGPAVEPTEPDEPVEDVAAEDLGAVPAWRAVVDRDMYLARRGQHGVVFGRVGAAIAGSEQRWLIDETEGNGALAIRVHFAVQPPATGMRVAVGGAWTLDESRHWFWQADAVTPLPDDDAPPPAAPDSPVLPGLVVITAMPPGKVRTPDKVRDGDLMQFTVVSVPTRVGDGWGVSDQRWGTLQLYLRLPGEHPSFGGHDLRAPDERWTLKKQGTYWVRIGKVRRREGELPSVDALTPPVRLQ